MKKHTWLIALTALFLAGTLTWADLSYAQPAQRGRSQGAVTQGAGRGRGPGNATCPNYPGYQKRGRGGAGKNQTGTCPRWGGATQTPAKPQSKTPAPQSGK